MKPLFLSMAPIQLIDIIGSSLMIVFAFLCVNNTLALKRKEPHNVIWTYLLWFFSGLLIFSISRSVGHLLKYILIAMGKSHVWFLLAPVSGSLNTISFIIVGSITLFFSRVYNIYREMIDDKSLIESANKEIVQLNVNLEKRIQERTQDLSESEEKYRRVFQGSKDMLFICNEKGDVLDINYFGVELLGFKQRREVLGRNFFKEFMADSESIVAKRDIENNDFIKNMEVKLKKRNGDEIIALFSATGRRTDDGKPFGFEGTVKDITIRKAMENQLIQADKLASLGQLSAGVAHEINNPLGLILGYTQLVLKEANKGEQLHEDLKIIEKHTMNCKRIVEDLLKFSRSIDTIKSSANINKLVSEVLGVVKSNFELDNVHVVEQLFQNMPSITVDSDKMRQVFMNILMNARQSIEGSGTIKVSTSLSAENSHVFISFKDTGCGIPNDIIHKIFDPFFTTKPTGMGTGLGLSVSYGIIQNHGGSIHVESTPNKGTIFFIELPIG